MNNAVHKPGVAKLLLYLIVSSSWTGSLSTTRNI